VREPRLDLVLLWHMHQPDYRDAATGQFLLPWTYLHAIKDYSDMAGHAERHPGVRSVFNFVPVLLEQIEDYVRQFNEGRMRDPLLGLLQVADLDRIESDERALILHSVFASNHRTMLDPFPQYRRLYDLYLMASGTPPGGAVTDPQSARDGGGARFGYLSGAFLADAITWYHLVWLGETVRRTDPLFGQLIAKGSGFTHADRLRLFEAIGAILRGLLPRYRALAERGSIELSSTPHTHPLAPLLIDFACARQAQPDAALPRAGAYPGGAERVRRQVEVACASHRDRFGAPPTGLWPAEGAVSDAFVGTLAEAGLRWAASSESVLANSLGAQAAPQGAKSEWLHRRWRSANAPALTLMFRDERLSDLIGFEYSRWDGRDAAAHLIGELEAIATNAAGAGDDAGPPSVLIALDGENAWEYYPYNGYYFLDELYARLEAHPWIRTRTMRELLDDPRSPPRTLPRLLAGSWVMGTMSTWIGEPAKNLAWDLLCEAKAAYDSVLAAGELAPERRAALERQLAGCESSDWFWWLGPYNPAESVARFERLFRLNLKRLYQMIGVPAPAALDLPFDAGAGDAENAGTMRRARETA